MQDDLFPIPVSGDPGLDDEHREILDVLRRFDGLEAPSREERRHTLRQLFAYVQGHTTREEHLMGEVGYPYLDMHRAEHRDLEHCLGDLIQGLIAGTIDDAALSEQFLERFGCHVVALDGHFARWMRERG